MKKLVPLEGPRKTVGDQFIENIAFVLIAGFAAWLIERLITYLFSPIAPISRKEVREELERKVVESISKREYRLDRIALNELDPMHQFQVRFIINPEQHKDDPDNEKYYAWYRSWKAGEVIDTTLRWAPPMYDDDGLIKANFLDYLALQKKMHVNTSKGMWFLLTIHEYYPEFTPSWEGLDEDIVGYRAEVQEVTTKDTLVKEAGLPKEFIEELDELHLSPGRIPRAVEFLRTCHEFGYDAITSIVMYDNNVKPGSPEVEVVQKILFTLHLPRKAVTMCLRHEIDSDDLVYLTEKYTEARDLFGSMFYSVPEGHTRPMCYIVFDEYVSELTAARRARRVERICGKKI